MEILHYTAFTTDPHGGNQAGVVISATPLDPADMQAAATRLGYSESAFLLARLDGSYDVRYFAPAAEVPFCGHATIAAAVALAHQQGAGTLLFHTVVGDIPVTTVEENGTMRATLTSVEPKIAELPVGVRRRLLAALHLDEEQLDKTLPLLVSFAGNWHPIVPVASEQILASLDYDFDPLAALMAEQGWLATINVVHRLSATSFSVRNPFPPGGVREDAATGSAASSLGGYLRHVGELQLPAKVTVTQGQYMGRPSELEISIGTSGGIDVRGTAVPLLVENT